MKRLYYIFGLSALLLSSCNYFEYDNYEAPNFGLEVQDESKVLGIHDITFTYTTEVKNAGDDGTEVSTNGSGEKVIKNSVSDNHDNNENGEVTISTREQLVKTLKSNANDMEYVSDMTENEAKILKWELNLIQDTGFPPLITIRFW